MLFKYSIKKLLTRKIVGLICLCIFALLIINEPFWHLRPYIPESLAYILNGPPRLEHYMCPEQLAHFRDRSGNSPLTEETLDAVWAFYAIYGDLRPTTWYLEIPRRLILISLLWMATPIISFGMYANKRVCIRLTKKRFCWYSVWLFVPVASENSIEWSKVEDVALTKSFLSTHKSIIVHYTDTIEENGEKKTAYISTKHLEHSADNVLQSIHSYMLDKNE